ncbi:MAG: aminoacetone oxidase family FAD-binding enzyme [Campylobacterales bacterium]|nr:aminoacetone oxidase family FAD-binding enzyme [Campylobacterales bacterium]
MNPIVIIGGGASALMLASLLPSNRATLIETNTKIGAKMQVSGGGKCNITNRVMDPAYYLGEEYFIQPALDLFDEKMLLAWLAQRGLEPVIRKGSQYFCPHSSKEILGIFQRECSRQKILLGEKVVDVTRKGKGFEVKTDKRTLSAERVVVASGGLSYPQLNASDIGYRIAESFGHTVVKTAPALVGLTLQPEQFFFKELSGASTEVRITVGERVVEGALLFAHKGVSGPAVLNASLYWEKGKIEIDFLPDVDWDAFVRSEKQISSLLPMPKRVTKAFLIQLDLQDKQGKKVTSPELERLKSLCRYSFAPAGTFGYSKAEVTKGGVSTDEVNAYTMMSEKEEGLYFIGEVLDVTGRLGGYNFQWAFSSAYVCYQHLINQ